MDGKCFGAVVLNDKNFEASERTSFERETAIGAGHWRRAVVKRWCVKPRLPRVLRAYPSFGVSKSRPSLADCKTLQMQN